MSDTQIQRFSEYLRAGGRSESTIKLRRSHLVAAAKHLKSPLEKATAIDLISYLSGQEWKASTRRSHRASITLFFAWLHDNGHRADNPAARIPSVMQPRSLPRPAADPVIAAAIDAAPPRTALMIELMAYAGLRRMEVCKVHSKDVIMTASAAALRVTGKGGHTRIIPIPGHLASKIRKRKGWLFPGDDHGHLSAAYVGKLVSRALPDGITGHQLRHRYATEGYRRGRDIRAVQSLLGHAKLDTTMIYTAVSDDAAGETARLTWTLSA